MQKGPAENTIDWSDWVVLPHVEEKTPHTHPVLVRPSNPQVRRRIVSQKEYETASKEIQAILSVSDKTDK